MKQKTLTLVLFLFMSVTGMAQVVPYVVYPEDANHTLTLLNLYKFTYAQHGAASNQKAYTLLCNSETSADFSVAFSNPDVGGSVKYYIEFYRVYFNPSNGTPFYTPSVGGTKVFSSPEIVVNSSASLIIHYSPAFNIESNAYYYAVIRHKRKVLGVYQASWRVALTNNVNFLPGANPIADGNINTVSSISLPSYYGPLTVGEIDPTQAVILDAAPSSCELNYGITIDELNLATWTPVPGKTVGTGWLPGQAGSINLSSLYSHGFVYGKTYQVSLHVGPVWNIKYFYITPKPPLVVASVNFVSSALISGRTVYTVANCDNVILNMSGTKYVTKYKIDVDRVSATFDIVPGTNFNTGWQFSIPPSYDISALSGYTLGGGIYRISLNVLEPAVTKNFYVRFTMCPRSAVIGNNEVADVEENESAMDISVYPNPGSGLFNLRFNSDVDGLVNVYDMTGRKVKQLNLVPGTSDYSFDLSDYTKGIYVVEATVNGSKYIRKVILQ